MRSFHSLAILALAAHVASAAPQVPKQAGATVPMQLRSTLPEANAMQVPDVINLVKRASSKLPKELASMHKELESLTVDHYGDHSINFVGDKAYMSPTRKNQNKLDALHEKLQKHLQKNPKHLEALEATDSPLSRLAKLKRGRAVFENIDAFR
jgi:exonuclease VII large subunit